MSIPADHIKFSDDSTTAWWVVPEMSDPRAFDVTDALNLDRPCSTCDGDGREANAHDGTSYGDFTDCLDCHGSGRHCFDIAADQGWMQESASAGATLWHPRPVTLTVSVVPGMVLPIVGVACPGFTNDLDRPAHIHMAKSGETGMCVHNADMLYDSPWKSRNAVDLPFAAAVGMFAVRLNVHTPIGAGS